MTETVISYHSPNVASSQCDKESSKIVAEIVSHKLRTCSLDIYGISSQHFDLSLKLMLFETKFNRAKLIVFAFSDYNFPDF